MKPVAVCGLLILCSCSTMPREEMPVELPPAFSGSGSAPMPDRWWLSFNDSKLNKVVEAALDGNFGLKAAYARLDQARAAERAASAGLWPSLDGSAEASRTREESRSRAVPADGQDTGSTTSYRDGFSLGLAASYELDLWGRLDSLDDAAEYERQASENELMAAAITLSAEAASAWYQLAADEATVILLKEQVATSSNVLKLVEYRFRLGEAGAQDVLQQRQQVESVRGEKAAAEADIAITRHRIATLMGLGPVSELPVANPQLILLPPLPKTGLPSELIARRPDVRRAWLSALAADERAAAATANRLPRLTLSARASTSAEATRDLFDNWLASIAAGIAAPLFDAGARSAEAQRTRAVVMERFNGYADTALSALVEVENALTLEKKQGERAESLRKQAALSEEVIQRVTDNYRNGTVDYLRVLNSLLSDQQIRRALIEQDRRLLEIRIGLCRALAGGWTLKGSNADKPYSYRMTEEGDTE